MTGKKRFESLVQLLGSYFHQDWTLEHETYQEVIAAIRQQEPRSAIEAAIVELDRLLAQKIGEGELQMLLTDEIGCYFAPQEEGLTNGEWLNHVRELLAKP